MPRAPLRGRARLHAVAAFTVVAAALAGCGSGPAESDASGGSGGSAGAGGAGSSGWEPAAGGWGGDLVVDERCTGNLSYEACGGVLDGTWTVDYACGRRRVEIDRLWGDVTSFDCWISADLFHEAHGTLAYQAGRETADLSVRAASRYLIPDACAVSLEPDLPPAEFCRRFEDRLPADRIGGCAYGPDGCACDFRLARTLGRTWPYEQLFEGRIVEFPADDEEGFSFCVDGDRMVQARGDMYLHLAR